LILWSPRYFTRLWCVFEVASWVYLGKDLETSVRFMPVALARGICIVSVVSLCFYTAFKYAKLMPGDLFYPISSTALFFIFVVSIRSLRRQIHDLRSLESQLTNFSVRRAECFCCSNDHVLPGIGTPLPCDREVVYNTLQLWFVKGDESQPGSFEAHLDAFDTHVRTKFAPMVLRKVGGARLEFRHTMIMGLPFLWYAFDEWAGFDTIPTHLMARKFGEQLTTFFSLLPNVMHVGFQVAALLDKHVGVLDNSCIDFLVCSAASLVIPLVALFLWFVLTYANNVASSAPCIAVTLAYFMLTAVLFRHSWSTKFVVRKTGCSTPNPPVAAA